MRQNVTTKEKKHKLLQVVGGGVITARGIGRAIGGGMRGAINGIFNGDGFVAGAIQGAAPGLGVAYVGLGGIAMGISNIHGLEYNDDISQVFDSTFSNYHGQVVWHGFPLIGANDGMSLGPFTFLGSDVRFNPNDPNCTGRRFLRHEHGHYHEYLILGFLRYLVGIGFPSVLNHTGNANRNNQPWEVHAEMLAGVYRSILNRESSWHTLEGIAMGMLYFEFIYSNTLGTIAEHLVDFANHNFAVLKEGRL